MNIFYLLSILERTHSIRYVALLGERNSGTNYIENLVLRFTFAEKHPVMKSVDNTPVGSKHLFRSNILTDNELDLIQNSYTDFLWIFAVRNPCDWADAMYRKPWHLCAAHQKGCMGHYMGVNLKAVQHKSRKEFFSMRWVDFMDKSGGFENVFELRAFKLKIMQQIMRAIPKRVYIARLHEIERDPKGFLDTLERLYGIRWKRRERIEKGVKHNKLCLNNEEYNISHSLINWDLEKEFGYMPSDCHIC